MRNKKVMTNLRIRLFSVFMILLPVMWITISSAQQKQYLVPSESIRSLEWNSDGTKYVIANPEGLVSVRDQQGNLLWSKVAHQPTTFSVSWSPDDNFIVSGGSDAMIHIWDSSNGDLVQSFEGIIDGNYQVLWLSDGAHIAILGLNEYGIWELSSGTFSASIGGGGTVWHIALNPVDNRIATVSATGNIVISNEGSPTHVFDGINPEAVTLTRAVWKPDGSEIAVGSFTGTVRLWDMSNYGQQQILAQLPTRINALKYSPDGSKLAASVGYYDLYVLDAQTGAILEVKEVNDPVADLDWHPDGTYLIYGKDDGTVESWSPSISNDRGIATDEVIITVEP